MKIKPQIFTAVTAGVFVITILVYVLSLVIDFKQQSARSAIKFETISASLNENLMEKVRMQEKIAETGEGAFLYYSFEKNIFR